MSVESHESLTHSRDPARGGLRRRIELVALFARKEWHIRYRSAKLGYAWAVLQPLMLMAVLLVIFGYVVPLDREKYPETAPYPLFLLCGLFPWHFASVAVSSATPSYPNSGRLVKFAGFPRETLPLGVVAAHLVNLLLTLPLLIPLYFYFHTLPTWWMLALPVPIVLEAAIVGALALIAAISCVRFTDTFFLVQALLLPWFYATPIFYPLRAAEKFGVLPWLNPLTGVMELYRHCLMPHWPGGAASGFALSLAMSIVWAVVLGGFAAWLLRRAESTLADWL